MHQDASYGTSSGLPSLPPPAGVTRNCRSSPAHPQAEHYLPPKRDYAQKFRFFLCSFSTSDNATEMADHFLERKFAPELIYGHIRKLVLIVLCKKGPILFKHAAKNIINTRKHVEFLKVSLLTCLKSWQPWSGLRLRLEK